MPDNFKWAPHAYIPDLDHVVLDDSSASILRAKTTVGEFYLGGFNYELYDVLEDRVLRFNTEEEVLQHLQG